MALSSPSGFLRLWSGALFLLWSSLGLASASRTRRLRGASRLSARAARPLVTRLSHSDYQARSGRRGTLPKPGDTLAASNGQPTFGTEVSARQMEALLAHRTGPPPGRLASLGAPAAQDGRPRGVQRLLADRLGTEYMGSIGVGTRIGPTGDRQAESVLDVIFDTGSTDLWVASILCTSGPCARRSRRRFNYSNSETFRMPRTAFRLTSIYGSGQLRGFVGLDDVRVGPLVARRQGMGLIEEEQGMFEDLATDGILGLGFAALSNAGVTPLFDSLIGQRALPVSEFAFYLHPDFAMGGVVLWGGIDKRLYQDPLIWYPVVREDFWALDLAAFSVGNRTFKMVGHDISTRPLLIIDSGTTFLTAMGEVYRAIAEAVHPVACPDTWRLPPLVYTLRAADGQHHNISVLPEEYMVRADMAGVLCAPGIMEFGSHFDGFFQRHRPMMLGEVFMRHHFTVFRKSGTEGGRAEVGIARSAHGAAAQAFLAESAYSRDSF